MAALEPVTVQLISPVKCFGKMEDALVISREVNGGDLLAVDGMEKNHTLLTMISRLYKTRDGNALTMDAVKALSLRDIQALEAAMAPFAGGGQESESGESGTAA